MRLILAISVVLLASCAPWRTTTQPEAQFRIMDSSSIPVEGARVHLASYSVSKVPKDTVILQIADDEGRVHFPEESYWQLVVVAPGGATFYGWSFCIDKPGFKPHAENSLRREDFVEMRQVVLESAEENLRCEWIKYPYRFEVEATEP